MSNPSLDECLADLRRQLCFLPEAELEREIAEFRSHLLERSTMHEAMGETPERALTLALEKWGDLRTMVRALRMRWMRRKIDHPALVALFLLGAGQWFSFLLSSLLYRLYRSFDPDECFGIVRLVPEFPGSVQPPCHTANFPYIECLILIHIVVAATTSLFVVRLRLRSQRQGVLLYTVFFFALVWWADLRHSATGYLLNDLTLHRFLLDPGDWAQRLLGLGIIGLHRSYYFLIVFLFLLRTNKKKNRSCSGKGCKQAEHV